MKNHMRGVLAALATPMTQTQQVDLDALARMADHLIGQGLHGLIPLGTTGEFYALSGQERMDVLRVTLEVAGGRVPVLAGANAGSTQEVIYYCRQAERMGAHGVMLAPPYYACPTPQELLEHLEAVDSAVGIPIMLYNCPSRTGIDMTPQFIERLADLANIRYVKESTGRMDRITRLIRACGDRLGVFCGCDTIALESLMVGAAGWVGGMANVLPGMHVQLYRMAVERKDYAAARRLFYRMLPVLEMAEESGKYVQVVKAGCRIAGHPAGPPRSPLSPLNRSELAALHRALRPLIQAR